MSKVYSIRVRDEQVRNLERLGRQLGRSPGETAGLLIEEGLRRTSFASIDFRDSPGGRQAYVTGSGMAVWEVAMLLNSYEGDPSRVAAHLEWPVDRVEAARNYAQGFPEEIRLAIEDNNLGFEELKRILPRAELISARAGRRRKPPVRRHAPSSAR